MLCSCAARQSFGTAADQGDTRGRYNDAHHYRAENPLDYLHKDEAPVESDKLKSFH